MSSASSWCRLTPWTTGTGSIGAENASVPARIGTPAIETHQANFPGTDHDCADISQVEPRRYRRTDILWASPECTNHSNARGRKRQQQPGLWDKPDPAAVRSRATMWDVPRFTEHHRYEAVIVENVVEAAQWEMSPRG